VRCKPEFTDAIFEDLHWLGLNWPEPVRRQSQHLDDYAAALDVLRESRPLPRVWLC
jgi:glutamyl-Q tRNA(Asp) synthetase